jgi:hypothetical protein
VVTGSVRSRLARTVPTVASHEVGDAFGLLGVSPEFRCSDPSTGVLDKGQRSKGRSGWCEPVARE